MIEKCPCHNCKDRKLVCHDKCSRYQTWKTKRNDEIEQLRMIKELTYSSFRQ